MNQEKNNAQDRSYWLKAGMLSLLERFSLLLFGFGSFFLLIRMLSKEDFGVWIIFLTLTTVLEMGKIGLLQNALVKFLTNADPENYGKITTASLVINFSTALTISVFLLSTAYLSGNLWSAPQLISLLPVYALTTWILGLLHQSNFIQQANFDFRGVFWSNFVRQGLFFILILCFYCLPNIDMQLMILVIAQIFTAIAGLVVSIGFGKKYLQFNKEIDWSKVKQLFHYGKFVMGTNLSTMLYKTIDKMMLGALLNPVSVALYEAAVRINSLIEVPTFSIAAVVFPESARRSELVQPTGTARLYEKAVGATLTFICPSVLFVLFFAEWIIWIVAGNDYLAAVPLLRLSILTGIFIPFAVQFGTILDSTGRPMVNFLFTFFGTFLNILMNYLFIHSFGVIGAPIGTLATYLCTFLFMQTYLNRLYGVKAYRVFNYMFLFYLELWQIIKRKFQRFTSTLSL